MWIEKEILLPRLLHLLQVGPELFRVGFADLDAGHLMEAAGREHGLIAVGQAGEDADGIVAVIIRLLADGAVHVPVDDALENRVRLVDGHVYGTVSQQPYYYGYESVRILAKLSNGDKSAIPAGGFHEVSSVEVRKANVEKFWADLKKMQEPGK